ALAVEDHHAPGIEARQIVVAAPHRGKPCHTHRVMTNRSAFDRVSPVVGRPPLVVVFVAILVIALGELGGAVLSQLRPATARWAAARVAANPQAHGLTGAAEYDETVRAQAVFATEAGLSFFHTHAEGTGLVLFFAATLVASLVRRRATRAALYALLTMGALFPLGYLVYAFAVLRLGRDAALQARAGAMGPDGNARPPRRPRPRGRARRGQAGSGRGALPLRHRPAALPHARGRHGPRGPRHHDGGRDAGPDDRHPAGA